LWIILLRELAYELKELLFMVPFLALGGIASWIFIQLDIKYEIVDFGKEHSGDVFIQIAFVFSILIASFTFFLMRLNFRRIYAGLEIFVGIVIAEFAFNQVFNTNVNTQSLVNAAIAILGAIYIIVRGLDNWQQGTKAAQAVSAPAPAASP